MLRDSKICIKKEQKKKKLRSHTEYLKAGDSRDDVGSDDDNDYVIQSNREQTHTLARTQ